MDFVQPNIEVGWKMANDQLLFLAHINIEPSGQAISEESFSNL